MTAQQRLLISLDEVLAFYFECPKCHAKMSLPVAGNRKFPSSCSYCEDEWVKNHDTFVHSDVFQNLEKLRESFKMIAENIGRVGCEFRLEIRVPAEEE